jgi:hypothetical protein
MVTATTSPTTKLLKLDVLRFPDVKHGDPEKVTDPLRGNSPSGVAAPCVTAA